MLGVLIAFMNKECKRTRAVGKTDETRERRDRRQEKSGIKEK